jgi:hypothetical protein
VIYKFPLFETPVYKFKFEKQEVVKNYFLNNLVPVFEKEGPNNKDLGVFSNYFPTPHRIPQDIQELYQPAISRFLIKAGFTLNIPWRREIKFWFNIGRENSYQEEHHHVSGPKPINYAGIHYVIYDSAVNSKTYFKHPAMPMIISVMPSYNEALHPTDFSNLIKTVDVSEGDIIIFPSYLSHLVAKQHTSNLRATLAFNISITDE